MGLLRVECLSLTNLRWLLKGLPGARSPPPCLTRPYSGAKPKHQQAHGALLFDWRQSVLLASASFEAYLGLAKEVSLPDETVTGARITYVDRDFVRDRYQGLVEVRLLSVTGLEESAQVRELE